MLISLSGTAKPIDEYTKKTVTHERRDATPPVTFPVKQHCHCPLANTHFPIR